MRGVIGILTGKGPACDELQEWLERELVANQQVDDIARAILPLRDQPIRITRIPGNQIAWQRNSIIRDLESSDQFVLYVDNDCVPPPGALVALWQASALSGIAAGACIERVLPFDVCAVKSLEPYTRFTVADVAALSQPIPVIAAGTGCMMIRRDVFRDLRDPWFRCGQIHPELISEDLDFCLRATEVGHPTYLVPSVKVGHHTDVILWPGDDGAHWAQWLLGSGRAPYRLRLPSTSDQEVHG